MVDPDIERLRSRVLELEQQNEERTRDLVAANAMLQCQVEELSRSEKVVCELERECDLILNNVPNLVSLLKPDGVPERMNRRISDFTGKTPVELMGWGASDLVHPEDRQQARYLFESGIGSGEPFEIVYRMRRFDGVYRWFHARHQPLKHADGRIARWCVAVNDIDDRKRAEESLTLTINTIPALAWSARIDGSTEFLNQHYMDYIGLSAEQAQSWDWTVAVHPDDLGGLVATWQRIMALGKTGQAEARLRRFDGVYRSFLFHASPLRDETGDIVKWYGTNIDIEDRKRTEEALSALRSEFAQLSRVSSLGVLTASFAHELSQPLLGILTNASTCQRMLAATPPNVEGALETVRRTVRDGMRASEVIERLRALLCTRTDKTEQVDLNEAVAEVLALASTDLMTNSVVIRTELAQELPRLTVDRLQLQQVVLNLLLNAVDSMSHIDDRKRLAVIRTALDGEGVRVSVEDVGVGFAVENAERLFQAFYTTKSCGMGIGLSLSRSIIARHDGRLWGEPNAGPGATFSFFLPARA
jgi:PAS domain S-box-containing protein